MVSIRAVAPQRDFKTRPDPLRGERVEFPGRRGNLLVGDLHRSVDSGGPALVLCHGMESTRGGTKQTAIVERFVPKGWTVLRFDFSYVGESEGVFEDLTISGEVEDVLGALDFLTEFAPTTCVLVGSSLGGTVALLAASHAPEKVNAVATIAAVADAALFTASMSADDVADWRRAGRRRWGEGWMRSTFLDDLGNVDVLGAVRKLSKPLLVMHGQADDVVPFEHAERIAAAAAGDVRLEAFPGVAHRFEEPGALEQLLAVVEEWLGDVLRERDARA
jgi:putative redox protein